MIRVFAFGAFIRCLIVADYLQLSRNIFKLVADKNGSDFLEPASAGRTYQVFRTDSENSLFNGNVVQDQLLAGSLAFGTDLALAGDFAGLLFGFIDFGFDLVEYLM